MKHDCDTCRYNGQSIEGRPCRDCGIGCSQWAPPDKIRCFETGATRDTDYGKLDYEGFLSPLVLERFAQYMDSHRKMADGSLRDSDNWQKGIPQDAYMKSAWRHFMDVWKAHRGVGETDIEEALCALLFNVQGYLHEHLKEQRGHV
jgi:hypothetical protein